MDRDARYLATAPKDQRAWRGNEPACQGAPDGLHALKHAYRMHRSSLSSVVSREGSRESKHQREC